MKAPSAITLALIALLSAGLAACSVAPITVQPPQPPAEYLANALDWIDTHAVKRDGVDWTVVRREALALAPNPQTTADTYPALGYAVEQLGDPGSFFIAPDVTRNTREFGFLAIYPDPARADAQAVIVAIDPGGPAERAGLALGDIVETVNGKPARSYRYTVIVDLGAQPTLQLTLRRDGQAQPITVTLEGDTSARPLQPTASPLRTDHGTLGYVLLPTTSGDWRYYPTVGQQVIRALDQATPCGWIVDLRRNRGGDLWTYLAAVGPLLGDGEPGGFVYPDGTRESWEYRSGKVYWAGHLREDGEVEGSAYTLRRPQPPVALLTSRVTIAAGELTLVAFRGRPAVRSFGEPTAGDPFLSYHTSLSDGAFLAVSGAYGMDRTGQLYTGVIAPDEAAATDWIHFGTARDPAVQAAMDWLLSQPACAQ